MGIIKRGILGGFSKKVANVVGSSWKGIAYMRSLPLSVANPRTPAQQLERSKFKVMSILASSLLSNVIRQFWNHLATRMSGYNLFVKTNIVHFDPVGALDYSQLQLSIGSLTPAPLTNCEVDSGNGTVEFDWDTSIPSGGGATTDNVRCVLIDTTDGKAVYMSGFSQRQAGGLAPQPFDFEAGHTYAGYTICWNAMGAQSNSAYLAATVV